MINWSNKLDGKTRLRMRNEVRNIMSILPSLYYTNQTYGALNKCWLGFTIAKVKNEADKIEMYARRIQKLEKQLGRAVTNFSNWGIE